MNVGYALHPPHTSFQPASHTQNSNPPLRNPAPTDSSTQDLIASDLSNSVVVTYLDELGQGQDAKSDATNNAVHSAVDFCNMLRSAAFDVTAESTSPEQKLDVSAECKPHEAVKPKLGAKARQFLTDLPHYKSNWSARGFGDRMSRLLKGENSLSLSRSDIEDIVACAFAAILFLHYEANNPAGCRTAATSLLKRCAVIVSEINQYTRHLTNKAELSSEELSDLKHYSALASDIHYMVLSKDMPRAAVHYIATGRAYLAEAAREIKRKITPERFSWHPLSYIESLFPLTRIEVACNNPEQFREVTYEEFVREVAPELQLSSGVRDEELSDTLPVQANNPSEVGRRK